MMRFIGIDAGIANCGWSVVEQNKGGYSLLDCGLIKTGAESPLQTRLVTIQREIFDTAVDWEVDAFAIERVFFNRNVKSAMSTGMVVGVCAAVAGELDRVCLFLTPGEVKSATGVPKADKRLVLRSMSRLLQSELNNFHTADAAAAAVAGVLWYQNGVIKEERRMQALLQSKGGKSNETFK